MKLVNFSIKNYRSISTAYQIPLTDYSVIVGPNNEGKSNILKGLGLTLTILTSPHPERFNRIFFSSRNKITPRPNYRWERDYPINLQSEEPPKSSEFICEFELSEDEFKDFKKKTGINLTTNLRTKITIGKNEEIKFDFLMKGKGKQSLNNKKSQISRFINEKLSVIYIPSIRTSELAVNIVNNLLERELLSLEKNSEFRELIDKIKKLQQPIVKKIAKSLKDSIASFIPDVKSISIKNRESLGRLISASCRVYINDGIETDLEFKGDGVISLTAISLLQHFSKQGSLEKGLILLLEEPESHLHPKAIHNLKKVLGEISQTNQIITTTHSPIIVERLKINQNIIVQKNKALSARSINEIRESLGITMSDNLTSAFLVLLVEGEEDIVLLKPWLEEKSIKIKEAIQNLSLIFDHLGGATNIGYKTTLYKNNLCNVIAYLDDDEAGRKGIRHATDKGILKPNEYILSSCAGMSNAELEDLIDVDVYRQLIIDDYGVNLGIPKFKHNRSQWSDRVRELFRLHGKLWDDRLESEIKFKVAKSSAEKGLSSLNQHKKNSIDALVSSLEYILEKRNQP